MEGIFSIIRSDYFIIGITIALFILFILYISTIIKLNKIKKNYSVFVKKLGSGENIQAILENYMDQVQNVKNDNLELKNYCMQLDQRVANCTQKVGLIRYSAFKDTGSDLSFALALLNEENTGIVLNGIYSREMSNIYAKPIEKGKSTYTLSDEEKQAINQAINN